jgi:2-oxoisovalerate dehydrogenase E2 component (dihydrolipoyl transacylase)
MTSLHIIKVPDVGEGIAEVELTEWHVKPGDAIAEDQVLASVMTDKANVDIPSPVAGRVLALGGQMGDMLAVGSELIRIELDAAGEPAAEQSQAPAPAPTPTPTPAAASTSAPAPTVAPPARASVSTPATTTPVDPSDRPIASPAVRRRAWELGIELKQVQPTGPAGRILHADLDSAAGPGIARPPRSNATAAPTDAVDTIAVLGLRRAIATRMQEAKRRIPHFSYVEEIDVTELETLRAALNTKWAGTRGRLTLLPLLLRAIVIAVREHPQVNAWFDDEAGVIRRHAAVHAGIATQTPQGLLVPVLRQAQSLDLWQMASEIHRLASAARAGQATRDELGGSTITVSSLGPLGGIVSTPVINRPEVAIVAVNRIVEKPVVRSGAVVVRQTMNLSSSFDHRVVDGEDAARFIQAVRAVIETPALLFVD